MAESEKGEEIKSKDVFRMGTNVKDNGDIKGSLAVRSKVEQNAVETNEVSSSFGLGLFRT